MQKTTWSTFFDFIIHKYPQTAAAQTMLCKQCICVKF